MGVETLLKCTAQDAKWGQCTGRNAFVMLGWRKANYTQGLFQGKMTNKDEIIIYL